MAAGPSGADRPTGTEPPGTGFPGAVLFCCDHNSVRSPMAEGMMKKMYGTRAYVQSAGVKGDREVDGFAVAVCAEIGVELNAHRARSFDQMEDWGDDFGTFDLIVALSPAAQRKAQAMAESTAAEVEYWAILDPTGFAESREGQLASFRKTRDMIRARMLERFGDG